MRRILSALCLLFVLGTGASANAQNRGFQLNRYEPTTAGEWSFSVDHPWYSSTRYFAAGVTLNYGHNPLVFGTTQPDGSFSITNYVIQHQLLGHIDLAGSFLDRVNISASLPIAFLERGNPSPYGVSPMSGVAVGDPRFGVMVRIFGQPDRSPISLSIGGQVWVPLRKFTDSIAETVSDQGVRVLPKLVLAGLGHHVRWSFTGGFLYRPESRLGNIGPEGSTAGSEVQLGVGISYADLERRFAVGPEATFATLVIPNYAFQPGATSLEVLLGAHYNVASQVQLGLAGGIGVLRQPGTPDFRMLFRVAYAPIRKAAADRDNDGIPDGDDACPEQRGIRTGNPQTNGCPPDRDRDGVADSDDLCPDTAQGEHPDPQRRGCPAGDRDGDGVLDPEDQCPDTAQGAQPDPQRKGCPAGDKDGDGVLDPEDQCPDTAQGARPDPQKKGCPASDKDGDGVADFEDQCPDVPAGFKPDTRRKGCPAGDRDHDSVVDLEDACPDQPGAPSPDPGKNGCPGMVEVRDGKIAILKPVFFATNKATILKKSFPLLRSVADALVASPQIKKVRIEGHTDNRGKRDHNVDLSDRRAKSVQQWLTENGVEASRLEAKGIGPDAPVADNKSSKGRAANRRVDFVITDPAQAGGAVQAGPVEAPEVVDREPGKRRKHRSHRHRSDVAAPEGGDGESGTSHRKHRSHRKADGDGGDGEKESGKHHRRHRAHKADADAADGGDGGETKKRHHRRKKKDSGAE